MNTPSKSKAEVDAGKFDERTRTAIALQNTRSVAELEGEACDNLRANEPTDAETLRALQFALAPLDRAMRDTGLESWQRQLMHRTVESEEDYNQRMDEREQDRHDMQEAE